MRLAALLRMAVRESRGARARLLFFSASLALGSLGVVGVASLVRSIQAGLRAQSKELLGADVWLRARTPLPEALERALGEARAGGARTCDVRLLDTMCRNPSGGKSRLVELKAVGAGFPFFGALGLEPPGPLALAPDEVAIAGELALALGVERGGELALGAATFRVAALVRDEPGRLDPTFTAGPRVFASLAGFERMHLGGPLGRITYGTLVALPEGAGSASDWSAALRERVPEAENLRIDTHEDAQPEVQRATRRVERFLGLVALLSLVLGALGVAEIVRAWIPTRATSIAVLRVLGCTPREVSLLYAGQVAWLALLGSALGALLGSLLPLVVPRVLPELLPSGLVLAWQPLSMLRGLGLGTAVALAFSLPSLAAVERVPTVRVLRQDAEPLPPRRLVAATTALAIVGSLFVAAWVQSGELGQAAWFSAGALALFALTALAARLLVRLARALPRGRIAPELRHGIAALARPGAGVLGALVALGLGTLVVTTLVLVETQLAARLANAVPSDGPSAFFLDVQPDQRATFERILAAQGAQGIRCVPLVTARLTAIDGRSTSMRQGEGREGEGRETTRRGRADGEQRGRGERGGRSRWALGREQGLTWAQELTPDNHVIAGALWSDPARLEISLERRYAEDTGAKLGTVLTFDVQGVPLELTVTSLREVDWESFGINFFLVAEPGALDAAPHMLLGSARLAPESEARAQDALAAELPNVTLIDVRSILDKVARVLARAGLAVQTLGAFTALVALVLLAAVSHFGAEKRAREAALWKVMGVTRAGVARLFALEFALLGAVAGLLGALGACALALAFFEHVLELGADIPWWTVPLAALLSAALAALSGLAACRRALQARPIESLRG